MQTKTGEVDTDLFERLEMLNLKKEELTENAALMIKNLEATVTARKAEVTKQKEMIEKETAQIERIKGYLIKSLNGEKFKNERVSISYRSSTTVNISDADALPLEYMRTKTTFEPDKTAIKNAIAEGKTVEGAEIINKKTIQIK